MPCFHPLRAYRTSLGTIHLGREPPDAAPLALPCGGCIGCRTQRAKEWALRCHLELQQHADTVFTTLTYSDENRPITLQKRHLQLFFKRLRRNTNRPIRFFASGEYGERTNRPHYHGIIYGLSDLSGPTIQKTWGLGHTKTVTVTPAAIAYTAGYCAKKVGWSQHTKEERIDYQTGECYQWQPPFIQMSRRPGIGGYARKWTQSWREYAIYHDQKMKVPRFLHDSWKATATAQQLEELQWQQHENALNRDTTPERLKAAEQIAIAKHKLRSEKRHL